MYNSYVSNFFSYPLKHTLGFWGWHFFEDIKTLNFIMEHILFQSFQKKLNIENNNSSSSTKF